LTSEDLIYVEVFDEFNGLDKETLRLINLKIESVKTQMEFKMS